MKVSLELQPCCGQRSGIGNYTLELIKRLEKRADLSLQGTVFNFLGRNQNKEVDGFSFPVTTFKAMPYGVYRRVWDKVPIPYSALFPKADIHHFFNYIVPPGVEGKVLTTVYDLTYLRYPETMDQSNRLRLERGMERSLQRADAVVTDSYFVKEEIVTTLGYEESRVFVVSPAAVPMKKSTLHANYLQEKWNISGSFILYLGNLEPRKNLERLLNAFALVRKDVPVQLVLAGGMGWNAESICARVEALNRNDIILTGYVSEEEKSLLLEQATLFAFPSVYEGFGMPILEAMEMGTPVVTANAASMPEIAGDAARLVNPFDERDIADGILEVFSNVSLQNAMREKGFLRCKAYSWENSANRLAEIYKSLGD